MAKQEGRSENAVERSVRTAGDAAISMAEESTRLVQAWAEAGTELATGSVRVLNDLVRDVAESMTPSEGRAQADDPGDIVRQFTDAAGDVTRNVNDAVAAGARVLQDGVDRFSAVYNKDRKPKAATKAAAK